ncbi:MAG: lytic murein transglycosylase [Elusimicrobia bacterium]|nr:lytic murein transglycosylase [Elusimicrobiota bacterium]
MRLLRQFPGIAACCLLAANAYAAGLSESEARFVKAELSAPSYGALFEEPSAEDLLRDHAHAVAALIRARLSTGESLPPQLLSEAKHLQRARYQFMDRKDRAVVDAALALRLGGFSVPGPGLTATLPPPAAIPPEILAEEDFPAFLQGVRAEAAKEGVPGAVLDEALTGLTVDQRVLDAENSQPEHTITFEEYLGRVVSEKRVAGGKAMLAEHAGLLDRASSTYGLTPAFLVAIWGMESNYGPNQGSWLVIRSLATLAFAGKRPSFFRKELMAALHILADEGMSSRDLKGSWAGAMGQPQFMPSTFRRLAVDFDGDGRRDIWKSVPDVLASMANYLAKAGWDPKTGWGAEVSLPADFPQASANLSVVKSVADWQAAGVRALAGALPAGTLSASIIRPSGPGGRAFLVLPNFRVVMRYNNSQYYATAGGLLADRVGAP